MKKIFFLFFICLLPQVSIAEQRALSCSFQGLKRNEPSIYFGSVRKLIGPKYDFDLEVPKTENKDWSAMLETLKIAGSVGTPQKGWVGLAFSSRQNSNDGWACIKLVKDQNLILTKSSGEFTVLARCTVH